MYTNHKSALYVVAMLKAQGINKIVISPGTSHNPLVRSIDEDPFFETYCITDERSAAFFAIGIAQEIQSPVAIMCTSGTATCNYITGVTEAYRRNIPLVIITADKHPYFLNQLEDQMINQPPLFREITKCAVTLPEIHNDKDEWYCRRLLNEAFLEMKHHGSGPIHINVPISYGMFAINEDFTTKELPAVNIIKRYDYHSEAYAWEELFASIKDKRILFLCGQNITFNKEEQDLLNSISKGFNCILGKDSLSNLHLDRCIQLEKIRHKAHLLNPDIVITLNGSIAANFKFHLKSPHVPFKHWLIHEKGTVADPYRKLSVIVETDTLSFLRIMNTYIQYDASSEYFDISKAIEEEFKLPELPYSQARAFQQFMQKVPSDCVLHIGNSSTIRLSQYFNFSPKTKVFCNRGVHGIDGCMSAFIGQATCSKQTCFLLIGDLTFFYDMNALWNRYVGKNVRILLFNNGGAALFHHHQGLDKFPSLNRNVAAEHSTEAKGWSESLGFKYLAAQNDAELEDAMNSFVTKESNTPILLEVFTDKAKDGQVWHSIIDAQQPAPPPPPSGRKGFGIKTKIKRKLKDMIMKRLGE